MSRSLSGACVWPHLRSLQRCGFCQLDPAAPRAARVVHKLYSMLVLCVTCTYLLQQAVYAYQECNDMDKLSRVLFLLLCHVTSIVKQFVFYTSADDINKIIAGLDEPLYNQRVAAHEVLLRATTRSARRLLWAYSGTAFLTCTLWIIFPVMYRLKGEPIEFPFWMNVDVNQSMVGFIGVLVYSYYITSLVGIANTAMDAFMGTVLLQCKTQLRILRMNFESLPERAHRLAQGSGDEYETALMKLFHDCLAHYRKISETTKLLQDIFGTAILVQFAIGGWILCMAAYKLVSLNILSIEFASMILFISCILTELFIYSYYGNEVAVESSRLLESLYSMEWLHTPLRFKKSLVLVMERTKRPLRPAAGLIIPLSLDTFVTIIKSSYTFYAVLRQTK